MHKNDSKIPLKPCIHARTEAPAPPPSSLPHLSRISLHAIIGQRPSGWLRTSSLAARATGARRTIVQKLTDSKTEGREVGGQEEQYTSDDHGCRLGRLQTQRAHKRNKIKFKKRTQT